MKEENKENRDINLYLISSKERRKVLGIFQDILRGEGVGCVHCPCYTSCTRC